MAHCLTIGLTKIYCLSFFFKKSGQSCTGYHTAVVVRGAAAASLTLDRDSRGRAGASLATSATAVAGSVCSMSRSLPSVIRVASSSPDRQRVLHVAQLTLRRQGRILIHALRAWGGAQEGGRVARHLSHRGGRQRVLHVAQLALRHQGRVFIAWQAACAPCRAACPPSSGSRLPRLAGSVCSMSRSLPSVVRVASSSPGRQRVLHVARLVLRRPWFICWC